MDLARFQAETDNQEEALQLAHNALTITERSEYVLKGADVELFLVETAFPGNDLDAAQEHARKARELACCYGPPDYTYKVAWEEAGMMLEELSG